MNKMKHESSNQLDSNLKDEKIIKKIKIDNEKTKSESYLLTPPEDKETQKKYDKILYNIINNEFKEIEIFMKSIYDFKNVDFDKFLGKSFKEVSDSLDKLLSLIDDFDRRVDLYELDDAQRKLFMVRYYLHETHVFSNLNKKKYYKDEINNYIFNDDIIQYCFVYNPYQKYYTEILFLLYSFNTYVKLFNYEHLTKITIVLYSNFIMKDLDDEFFQEYKITTTFLYRIINTFKERGLDKKDIDLFNRYLESNMLIALINRTELQNIQNKTIQVRKFCFPS